MDTRTPTLAELFSQGGPRLALAYAPLHALCVWLGAATTPAGAVEPVLWLPSGLLGAVVSSSAVGTWAWLLPAGTIAEFLASRFIAGGVWGADHTMVADALLALTTTCEAFLGGSLFRIWMQQRHPPATELILRGVFIVFVAVAGGAVLRTEIIGRLALDPRISIQTALAAPLLGSLAMAPLALALGFNARGHAGRSDGSQWELLLAFLTLLAVTAYVFLSATGPGSISIDYLLFPPVIWIATRFRPRVTFVTCAALAIGAALLHAQGFGQFSTPAGTSAAETLGLQIFLVMLLSAALLVAMTRHEYRGLQIRLMESTQRLQSAEDAGQLAAGIQLHDGVGQTLTALSLAIRGALRSSQLDRRLAGKLEDCRQSALEAHKSVRRLLAELHPPGLKDLGLVIALQSLIERVQRHDRVSVSLQCSGAVDPLPLPRRQLLYRCARELLSNVVRHAQVRQAELSLRETGGVIELEVRDQGVGWDAAIWHSSYLSGMPGLFSLKGQVELLGGALDVTSSPGQGCCVHITLPSLAT